MRNRITENIYATIKDHAMADPGQTMFAVNDETLSYGEFVARVDRLAQGLRAMRVTPRKKVGMIIANSLEWYIIYWAIVKVGAWPVPLDPQVGEWEMARLLALTEVEICFIASRYRKNDILGNILNVRKKVPGLKRIVLIQGVLANGEVETLDQVYLLGGGPDAVEFMYTPDGSDPLMLACTSGSTGNPKVIVVPHRGFHQSQLDMARYLGFSTSDRMLLGMPLYHQGGFGMGLQMILSGGTVCYQPVFEPEAFLRTIAEQKITVVQLTATLAKIILSVPDFATRDLSSVRMVYFAGEVLPQEVARAFFETRQIRVINVIGSSETGTMVVWDSDYDREVTVNEFRPLEFTRMKVLDDAQQEVPVYEVGTIYIHTDAILTAYFRNETETALRLLELEGERWFNTGDLGVRLAGDRVRFAGRAKRIIKRGSNLIYPEEIEAFLLTHPEIEAVAVSGVKHDLIGETIVAYIQPRQGRSFTRGDLVKFCQGKLSAYKIPDQVVMVAEIPHDIGKVQFKYLRGEEQNTMIPAELTNVNDIYSYFVTQYAPGKAVMGFSDRTVTLAELVAQVDHFTQHLIKLGVKPGNRVGYTLPNCPEVFYLFLAISRLGACAVPLFQMLPDPGKVEVYLRSNVNLVVTTAKQLGPLKEASLARQAGYRLATIDTNPENDYSFRLPPEDIVNLEDYLVNDSELPLLVGSSSGTTGIPKTVVLTQANVAAEIQNAAQMTVPVSGEVRENGREVGAFPLSTSVMITCLGVVFGGVMLIYSADISPAKFVQLIAQWKADSMSAPPAYYEALLSLPNLEEVDLSSVKSINTGMDFLTPSLLARLKAKFTGLTQFVNGYGLVETSNVFMVCKGLIDTENVKTTLMQLIGNGRNWIEVRDEAGELVPAGQTGELYVKGASVIHGYAGNAEATQQSFRNGWFRTGDIVINEGGSRVTLLGRKKYLIKRGGKSVSPIVVQNHLNRLAGVKNSAVVGVPHPLYGEMVWAFVVSHPGAEVQLKAVMKHCRAELANYMVPDQVRFVDEIPKNSGVGKVNYELLKEMAAKELQALQGDNPGA